MASDKWGIPFWYPTKKTAGVSGTGKGFFWQQNNDIFEDNDDGMVRLGKEQDDCKVINKSTGEWEFPYLTDGEGLSLSGPTGHHTGGVSHGCQGFAYMVDADFQSTNPTFRFRKEMYHVNYDTDPKTGTWSSSFATGPVEDVWKGYGWVCYVKPDGVSPGVDSRVCECWWNNNPVSDLAGGWKMIKRTEDKGGWGDGGDTCDGDKDQIGTWSNIQFRFKSSSSDFSLHPLEPEFEDGAVIHSIGKENMSFEDCVSRGYGYRKDMPNDIEMKCLIKWDAGGRGKCHFKNISLREIDPFAAPDDTPEEPEPGEEPTSTKTIQGKFKFQWDLNTQRTSACQGSGGASFYAVGVVDEKSIGRITIPTTIVAQQQINSTGVMNGKTIGQVDVPLKKVGSPTGTVFCSIWNGAGTEIYTSPTTFDPSTFTTSFVTKTFDFSTNTHKCVTGDRVGISYNEGDDDNYIMVGYNAGTASGDDYAYYRTDTGWGITHDRNFACEIWE